MRFLADENVSGLVVERLRADGFEVTFIAEAKSGATDKHILGERRRLRLDAEADAFTKAQTVKRTTYGTSLPRTLGPITRPSGWPIWVPSGSFTARYWPPLFPSSNG